MGKGQNKCTLETGEHNLKATAIFTQASKLKNLFNFKVNCNTLSTSIYIITSKIDFFLKMFYRLCVKSHDIRSTFFWNIILWGLLKFLWGYKEKSRVAFCHPWHVLSLERGPSYSHHWLEFFFQFIKKSHFRQLGDLCQLDMFSALWPMSVTWCHPEWLFSWSPSLWSSNIHLLHFLCHFHLWHLIYSSSYWGIVTLILKYFCCHSQFPAIYIMFYCAQNWFMSQFQLNMCTFGGLKESQETTIYIFTRYNGAFIQLW